MSNYKEYKELKQYVKSDVGFFLGCGPSINNITDAQWAIIKQHDIWVSNWFIYHNTIPDFYYAEIGMKYMSIWKERFRQKAGLYKDVKFMFHKDNPNDSLIDETPNIFMYEKRKGIKGVEYILDGFVSHSRGASLILILDMMCLMGYKKIILFGVDLSTSTYFWTGNKKYGKTHLQTNKNMKVNTPHTTAVKVIPFVEGFSEKNMNGNLYVGHKETALYPKLKYIDIEKEI